MTFTPGPTKSRQTRYEFVKNFRDLSACLNQLLCQRGSGGGLYRTDVAAIDLLCSSLCCLALFCFSSSVALKVSLSSPCMASSGVSPPRTESGIFSLASTI